MRQQTLALSLVAAGAAAVAALVTLGLVPHGTVQHFAPPASSASWQCREMPAGDPVSEWGYKPYVTISNGGKRALPVSDISVAVFSRSGQQVGSVDVFAGDGGTGTAYIAPGSAMTFSDDPDQAHMIPAGTCRVEHVQ